MKKSSYLQKYKLLILLIAFFSSKAFASDMDSFLKKASTKSGAYILMKSNSGFCDSGNLVFIDQKNPSLGLRVGQRIFLGPFSNKEKSEINSDGCKTTIKFKYNKNKVTQTSSISSCPIKFKKFEARSTQALEFKNSTVIYTSKESKINCIFRKKKGAK